MCVHELVHTLARAMFKPRDKDRFYISQYSTYRIVPKETDSWEWRREARCTGVYFIFGDGTRKQNLIKLVRHECMTMKIA